MKGIRRLGFILLVLFIGMIVGNGNIQTAIIVICPFFIVWFMLWDEKKYRQNQRRRRQEQQYYQQQRYEYDYRHFS